MKSPWLAAAGVGGLAVVTAIAMRRPAKRKAKKKAVPKPTPTPTSEEPWAHDTVADLASLSSFAIEDDPPVVLEPGGRLWVRIDESALGRRASRPTIGSTGDDNLPRPPCVMILEDVRRGDVRYVLVVARPDAAFCSTYIGWELVNGTIDDELGFRVRIEPPVVVGRRDSQAAGGHVVARPGQRVHLDCLGHLVGQVTVVLPLGEYSCAASSSDGAEALLVELDPRAEETVATWVVTRGGSLHLAHERADNGAVLTVGVVATDPVHRVGRL